MAARSRHLPSGPTSDFALDTAYRPIRLCEYRLTLPSKSQSWWMLVGILSIVGYARENFLFRRFSQWVASKFAYGLRMIWRRSESTRRITIAGKVVARSVRNEQSDQRDAPVLRAPTPSSQTGLLPSGPLRTVRESFQLTQLKPFDPSGPLRTVRESFQLTQLKPFERLVKDAV